MWVVHWLLHIFHLIFDLYFKLGVMVTTFTFTNNLASSSWNTDTATSINCLAISYLCAIFWWAWPWSIHYCKFLPLQQNKMKSSDWKLPISDFQIQFSMSKIIRIFLNFFFFIEEYQFRGTLFVIDIFWKLQFLKHFVY